MTDLTRLKVSLTKHNAHKVARLLKDYKAVEVFERLDEVHAEAAQARKNLSALPNDALPPVWEKVRELGPDAIDALVLVAIIFSHHQLISAMAQASNRRGFAGVIRRGTAQKVYSNFARVIDQLGYATKVERGIAVSFDLKGMFQIPGLGPCVAELLELKLAEASWDRSNTLLDEVVRLKFQDVFGITADELRAWLGLGAQPSAAGSNLTAKDQEFFQDPSEGSASKKFKFKPGHTERAVDAIEKSPSPKSRANRLHNEIQNKLYNFLKGKLGPDSVGTEQDTGSGTAIDLATQHNGKTTFYEIKTGASVRSCIRQALPQLLEYAFWPEEERAEELIIVSHLPLSPDGERYLRFLKKRFGLPISYKHFDLHKNVLR
ncbi:MAG TPA: hypothetical protein VFW28_05950 [Micropepsaceae bacterium]|nr:hypothetical protein [Micropepsaceae bacterium]